MTFALTPRWTIVAWSVLMNMACMCGWRVMISSIAASSASAGSRPSAWSRFSHPNPIQRQRHPSHPEGDPEHGWQLSGVEPRIESGPVLGQDNLPVFGDLWGLSDAEFADVVAAGVVL
jgi:hypothetical protein